MRINIAFALSWFWLRCCKAAAKKVRSRLLCPRRTKPKYKYRHCKNKLHNSLPRPPPSHDQYFHYQNDHLHAEQVPLADIAAQFGTPCYVYSRAALSDGFRQFSSALQGREHLICYAVKPIPIWRS